MKILQKIFPFLRVYIGIFILSKFLLKGLTAIQFDIDRGMSIAESILMGIVVLLFITYCIYHILKGLYGIGKRNLKISYLRIISLLMSIFIVSLIFIRLTFHFEQTSGIDILMNLILALSITIVELTEFGKIKILE